MTKPVPNFTRLDPGHPDVVILIEAMIRAREVVVARSWSNSQEPITEAWWADVLADPRARTRRQYDVRRMAQRTFYRLADEPRPIIEVACTKCAWKAAFKRAELVPSHGADYPLPDLLDYLAMPRCPKIKSQWDRCGVHYLNPIEGGRDQ